MKPGSVWAARGRAAAGRTADDAPEHSPPVQGPRAVAARAAQEFPELG
jgi:hypothetical protein